MNKSDMMVCTVCQQPKNELTTSWSQLLPGLRLFRCAPCHTGKKEPRFAIKMAARTMGNEAVRPWVLNHRYVGEEITLSEVV
jgi:hypothetical protein